MQISNRTLLNTNRYPTPEWLEIGPTIRVIVYPHPEAKELVPHVTPSVVRLLLSCTESTNREEMQKQLGIKNKKHFPDTYLRPTIDQGLLEMTIPDKPNSPLQKYRLTDAGRKWLAEQKNRE